jgi:hypothetical protein
MCIGSFYSGYGVSIISPFFIGFCKTLQVSYMYSYMGSDRLPASKS